MVMSTNQQGEYRAILKTVSILFPRMLVNFCPLSLLISWIHAFSRPDNNTNIIHTLAHTSECFFWHFYIAMVHKYAHFRTAGQIKLYCCIWGVKKQYGVHGEGASWCFLPSLMYLMPCTAFQWQQKLLLSCSCLNSIIDRGRAKLMPGSTTKTLHGAVFREPCKRKVKIVSGGVVINICFTFLVNMQLKKETF